MRTKQKYQKWYNPSSELWDDNIHEDNNNSVTHSMNQSKYTYKWRTQISLSNNPLYKFDKIVQSIAVYNDNKTIIHLPGVSSAH